MALTAAEATSLLNAIDTKLAALWSAVQSRQSSYYAAHGRYWQGLRAVALTPADGAEGPADPAVTPSYQGVNWATFGVSLPATLPMTVWIDQYDGPAGSGFAATAEVVINGRPYRRCVQVGPETWRARGWLRIDPGVG